jgi:hypothetical protein
MASRKRYSWRYIRIDIAEEPLPPPEIDGGEPFLGGSLAGKRLRGFDPRFPLQLMSTHERGREKRPLLFQ